jgi:MFS family permease
MMMVSAISMMVLSVLFLVVPGKAGIYVLCAFTGISAALFFPPFQIFMKAVDTVGEKPVTYSTGLYTFAWSLGLSLGPFVAGYLMETGTATTPGGETSGWRYAYVFIICTALLTAIGIQFLQHLAHPAETPVRQTPSAPSPGPSSFDYSRMPDLAWLGWIGAGVGVIVISIIRGVFPSRAVTGLHMADSTQGTIFFLLSLTQALTGLALCLSRFWMYRPLAVAAFGLVGMAGTLCFGFGTTTPVLYLAAMLFGVYSGGFFFYLVFHALAHPVKSAHYVAINESVVGIGGIIGPVLGGLLADRFGFGVSCLSGVGLVAVVTLFQMAVHQRHPPAAS